MNKFKLDYPLNSNYEKSLYSDKDIISIFFTESDLPETEREIQDMINSYEIDSQEDIYEAEGNFQKQMFKIYYENLLPFLKENGFNEKVFNNIAVEYIENQMQELNDEYNHHEIKADNDAKKEQQDYWNSEMI